VGSECDVDGIMELCRLTGARFQQVASRSFGAAFQHSLTRLMYQQKILIPYKEKPVDIPLSMIDLLKGDRGGHTFDAQVGFHTDVAEIDFTSMFPWLIYNKNISAETILTQHPPLADVPDLPFKISHKYKGLVAQAIKPLLDARMYYKNNPTPLHKRRAAALKWVLVTAYGYLRFREFKLGIASSHMAICAYARDIIIQSARLAEQRGFTVEHGIVDSLYIKKKNIQQQEVLEFCKELEQLVGIPISFEGIFKWIVFLPSINDSYRPLPATYYGVFRDEQDTENKIKNNVVKDNRIKDNRIKDNRIKDNRIKDNKIKDSKIKENEKEGIIEENKENVIKEKIIKKNQIKARGIAVRQRKTPLLIKQFQQEVLEEMAECDSKRQIVEKLPAFCRLLRSYARLENVSKKLLLHNIRISKDQYKHNLPQKKIINKLKRRKTKVLPGMTIKYYMANGRALLPDEQGKPDLQYYKKLLVRSLFMILQPFGISKNKIIDLSGIERQTKLPEFHPARLIPHYYVPMTRLYKSNKGLSERQFKKRLEKAGWEVWRGGSIHMLRKQELFPNVRRKYTRLILLLHHYHPHHAEFLEYLCHIHKGMPDFICFRKGEFKFVECKFKNESVSKRQRKCFERLQKQGFRVEVHKLVDFPTKVRRAEVNVVTGSKRIMEQQMGLRVY
jgi:DNA polymerase elongation subunit (family B)